MATTTNTDKYTFTADQIADLRDTELLSWAKVADRLGLGSPGAARRAYSALVQPHTASVLPRRSGNAPTPVHLADADLPTIREAIAGRTIVVQRKDRTETIAVAKVTSVKAGTINFNDGHKSRNVKADAIVATK